MFKFADIELGDCDVPEIGTWISACVQPQKIYPLAFRAWPGVTVGQPIINLTPQNQMPVEINTLFWPWGASRFARANFVVSTDMLEGIRATVYSGGAEAAADLVFSDGVNDITTQMWMLPATPLNGLTTGGMWLLSLVDERYWWWGLNVSLTVTQGTTEWTDLYDQITDITVNYDPVNAAYGKPPLIYGAIQRQLPTVLDAIGWSVQQRCVRDFDGTVTMQNVGTAQAIVSSNLAGSPTPFAGGQYQLTV